MPPRKLTPEAIASAAVDLADREGLEGLTMRSLARHLGVEAMSLYHHFVGKDALLDAVTDRALARLEPPPRRGAWRNRAGALARAYRAALLASPERGVALIGEASPVLQFEVPAQAHRLPLFQGAAVAAVLLFGFAFPPLLQLSKVPTLRVFRHELGPPRPFLLGGYALGVLALAGLLLVGSSTTRSGTLMPSILAWRRCTMRSWLAGS